MRKTFRAHSIKVQNSVLIFAQFCANFWPKQLFLVLAFFKIWFGNFRADNFRLPVTKPQNFGTNFRAISRKLRSCAKMRKNFSAQKFLRIRYWIEHFRTYLFPWTPKKDSERKCAKITFSVFYRSIYMLSYCCRSINSKNHSWSSISFSKRTTRSVQEPWRKHPTNAMQQEVKTRRLRNWVKRLPYSVLTRTKRRANWRSIRSTNVIWTR